MNDIGKKNIYFFFFFFPQIDWFLWDVHKLGFDKKKFLI
jgi:hypothetical protein